MIKKLTKPRVNYKKERIYQHQTNSEFAGLLELESWMQIYFMEKDGVVFTERGKYTGSGGRYSHGFFGHLFAELQNKGHKIDTYILKILADNQDPLAMNFDVSEVNSHDQGSSRFIHLWTTRCSFET